MFDFPPVLKGMMYATSGIGIVSNLVLGYAFLFKYPYIKAMQDNRQGLHRVILDIDKADAYTRGTYQGSTYYVRAAGQPQTQAPRARVKAQKGSKVRSRKEKRTIAAREESGMVAAQLRHQHQHDASVRDVGYKARTVPTTAPIEETAVPTPPPRLRQETVPPAPLARESAEGSEVRSRSLRKVADQ